MPTSAGDSAMNFLTEEHDGRVEDGLALRQQVEQIMGNVTGYIQRDDGIPKAGKVFDQG
jgi:hypothetical protein